MDEVIAAGMNALVTLMVNAGWSTIREKVQGILAKHRTGEPVEESTELEGLRTSLQESGGEEGFSADAQQRILALWQMREAAPHLRELAAGLAEGPVNTTNIVNNGKMVNHSGSGDVHVTL